MDTKELYEQKLSRFLERRGHGEQVKAFQQVKKQISDLLKSGQAEAKDFTPNGKHAKLAEQFQVRGIQLDYLAEKHSKELMDKGELDKEISQVNAEVGNEIKYGIKAGERQEDPEQRARIEEAKQQLKDDPRIENAAAMMKAIDPRHPDEVAAMRKQQAAERAKADMDAMKKKQFEKYVKEEVSKRKLEREARELTQENYVAAMNDPRLRVNTRIPNKQASDFQDKVNKAADEAEQA